MTSLLRRASAILDAPDCPLRNSARGAWRGLFASGGDWMRQALEHLRGEPMPERRVPFNRLGAIKYGLASTAAFVPILAAVLLDLWFLCLLAVPVFYAVEAQMVFLFPLVLDGCDRPFRESRRRTIRAGGTSAVMLVVLPLACVMLLGGFARQGFVRCWCLGCLAVCLWYEDMR